MSETLNENTSNISSPSPEETVSVGVADAAPSDVSGERHTPAVDRREGLLQRAKEKLNSQPASTEEPAASSDSTPSGDKGDQNEATSSDATGEKRSNHSNVSDSIAAPQDWSAEEQEAFKALPNDESRQQVSGFYKRFQGAFTQAMQSNAQAKQALRDRESQFEGLANLLPLFESGSEGVKTAIKQLATNYGVDIWTEKPLPEGEMPQFESVQEAAIWAKDQALQTLKNDAKAAQDTESQRQAKLANDKQISDEFVSAKQSIPDFNNHHESVLHVMSESMARGRMTPEQGYKVATYDGLRQIAQDGIMAKAELAELKKSIEQQKARSTNPSPGNGGSTVTKLPTDASRGESLLARAKRKIAAANG